MKKITFFCVSRSCKWASSSNAGVCLNDSLLKNHHLMSLRRKNLRMSCLTKRKSFQICGGFFVDSFFSSHLSSEEIIRSSPDVRAWDICIQMVPQPVEPHQRASDSWPLQLFRHHSNPHTPKWHNNYDEGIMSFHLNARDLAKLPEPGFQVILCCSPAVAFHVDLWIALSPWHWTSI